MRWLTLERGGTARRLATYRAEGFTPETATPWLELPFPLLLAGEAWRLAQAGRSAADYRRLEAEVARVYLRTGRTWGRGGTVSAYTTALRMWLKSTVDVERACAYLRAGISLTEALSEWEALADEDPHQWERNVTVLGALGAESDGRL